VPLLKKRTASDNSRVSIANNTKLGRYEIRSKIGEGGMGEVYLARDTQLDRLVALKLLSSEVARDPQRLSRFLQEARAASKLKSANVAHIYEIGEIDGHHFIAMEHVEGQPLSKEIAGQPMEPATIVKLGIQIARALEEAHGKGVTHRDIKPQNIIVTADGEAKVLDFGLAKLSTEALNPAELSPDSQLATKVKTSPGVVMGTVNYMSPEQAMGRDVDHRTDIFSLGAVLYEMATGRVPFSGGSLTETIDRIAHAQPDAISRYNYSVPAELEVIIKKALRKNRDERYQSARDLLVDLRETERELEFASRLEHSVAPSLSGAPASSVNSEHATEILTTGQPSLITSETPASPTHVSSAEYLTKEIKRHKKGAALVLALLLISAAAVAFGIYKSRTRRPPFNFQAGKMTRLTNNGKVGNAAISPDGKYVAYSALNDSGQSSLWVKHIATGSNVEIVPPAGPDVLVGQSTFSPDGNHVYYLRTERGGASGVLYQVPVLGGTSKKVLENASRISFSPDGKRFAFVRRYVSEGEDAVIVVNADGTGEQKLATRKHPNYWLPGAAWSPDGQTIACPAGDANGSGYRGVVVIQVSDGSSRQLTAQTWNDVQRIAWVSDGSGIMLTAQQERADQYQIWRVSYPDGEAQTLTNDLSDYRNLSLTADSNALVAVLYDRTANISVAPYGDWDNTRQLTSGKSYGGLGTVWTPDGKIVYNSRGGGNSDIWITDADGRNQKQLTDDASAERALAVSPDGRHIVFDSLRSGTLQIWRIDIDGSNAKQLTLSGTGFTPDFSADAKWVLYTTFVAGGFRIWKVPIDGGEAMPVINKYAFLPSVSPDGKLIACYYVDEKTRISTIALFPSEGGEPVKLFALPQSAGASTPPVRWFPDGRALTYISTRGGVSNIWLQPVDGGEPRQLTDFKTDIIFSFAWSRDGKQLALSRGTEDRDVILINNVR
jgi:serine/threonine protein kinase